MTVRFPRPNIASHYAALPAPGAATPVPAGSGPGILISLGVNAFLAAIYFETRRSTQQDAQRFAEITPPLRLPAPTFDPSPQDKIDLLEQEIARLKRSNDPLDQNRAQILSEVVRSLQLEVSSLQSPNTRNPHTIVNSTVSPAAASTFTTHLPLSDDEAWEMERYPDKKFQGSISQGVAPLSPESLKALMDEKHVPPRTQLRVFRLIHNFSQGIHYVEKILQYLNSWPTQDTTPAFNAAIEVAPQLLEANAPLNFITDLLDTIGTIHMSPDEKLRAFVLFLRGFKGSNPDAWQGLTEAMIQYVERWQKKMEMPAFLILGCGPEALVPTLSLIRYLQRRDIDPSATQALIGSLAGDIPHTHLIEALVTLNALVRFDRFTTTLEAHVRIWYEIMYYNPLQAVHYFRQIRKIMEKWNPGDAVPSARDFQAGIQTFGGYSRYVDARHRSSLINVVSDVYGPNDVSGWYGSYSQTAELAHAALAFWPEDYVWDQPIFGDKTLKGMTTLIENLARMGDHRSDVPTSWKTPIYTVLPQAPTVMLRKEGLLDPFGEVTYLISLLKNPRFSGTDRRDIPTGAGAVLRPEAYAWMARRPENLRRIRRLTNEITPWSLEIMRDILLDAVNTTETPGAAVAAPPTTPAVLASASDIAALSEDDLMAANQLIQIIRRYDPSVVEKWMQLPDNLLGEKLSIAVEQNYPLLPTASGFVPREWFKITLFQNPGLIAVVRSHFQSPASASPPSNAISQDPDPSHIHPLIQRVARMDLQWVERELAKLAFLSSKREVHIAYRAVKSPLIGLIARMMPDSISSSALQRLWSDPNFIPLIAAHTITHRVVQILPSEIVRWDDAERLVVLYMGAPSLVAQTADMTSWFDVTVKYLRRIAEAKGMAGVYLMEGAYSDDFGMVLESRQYPLISGREVPNLFDTTPQQRRLITLWEK